MQPVIYTVSQINTYVKSLLEEDCNLAGLYLSGEISNFIAHRSGHFYFSLKDDTALIKAVMFKFSAMHLRFMPQNGMKAVVRGRISLYERDGQYQFYADDIIPDGIGALNLAYEQLKERLEREGMRVELDLRNEKIGFKIREAQMQKTPYMLVLGDKEAESGAAAVRSRKDGDLGVMAIDDIVAKLKREIEDKAL